MKSHCYNSRLPHYPVAYKTGANFVGFIGPSYQITVIFPVHLEPIEGVTLGISHQLSDDPVLNPLQEVLQARGLRLVVVLLEELLRSLVPRLRLRTADGSRHCLDLCLSSVHRFGLTASLKFQRIKCNFKAEIIIGREKYSLTECINKLRFFFFYTKLF